VSESEPILTGPGIQCLVSHFFRLGQKPTVVPTNGRGPSTRQGAQLDEAGQHSSPLCWPGRVSIVAKCAPEGVPSGHEEGEARQLKTNPFPTQSYPTKRPVQPISSNKPRDGTGGRKSLLRPMLRRAPATSNADALDAVPANRFARASWRARTNSQRTSATYARSSAGPRIHHLDAPQTQPSSARLQRQQAGRGRLKPGVRQNRVTTALVGARRLFLGLPLRKATCLLASTPCSSAFNQLWRWGPAAQPAAAAARSAAQHSLSSRRSLGNLEKLTPERGRERDDGSPLQLWRPRGRGGCGEQRSARTIPAKELSQPRPRLRSFFGCWLRSSPILPHRGGSAPTGDMPPPAGAAAALLLSLLLVSAATAVRAEGETAAAGIRTADDGSAAGRASAFVRWFEEESGGTFHPVSTGGGEGGGLSAAVIVETFPEYGGYGLPPFSGPWGPSPLAGWPWRLRPVPHTQYSLGGAGPQSYRGPGKGVPQLPQNK
ncbi:hypothetical protein THAOC_20056, partial [Thalassiosira oceanica]